MAAEKNSLSFLLGQKIKINRQGYGAMQLTGPGIFGDTPHRDDAIKLLQSAVKSGVNFIDTADAYGPHTNETLIADALYPYPKELVIATKGGLERPGPNAWSPNGDPEYLRKAIDGSLKRLRVEQITLWQLHRIDPRVNVEESLQPVADAVKSGKIQYVGLSEVSVEQVERAQKILPIVSIQNLYNLGNRGWDSLISYTKKNNMAFIPWFPLASGPASLAGVIQKIAERHKATVAQIALAWLLKRSDNILLIPGTSSIAHLQENLQADNIELTVDEFAELSK
jgi:pyridoxine 4-dehydrogenase